MFVFASVVVDVIRCWSGFWVAWMLEGRGGVDGEERVGRSRRCVVLSGGGAFS